MIVSSSFMEDAKNLNLLLTKDLCDGSKFGCQLLRKVDESLNDGGEIHELLKSYTRNHGWGEVSCFIILFSK